MRGGFLRLWLTNALSVRQYRPILFDFDRGDQSVGTVARARKIERFLSQPFDVAQVFTGFPGIQVPVADTVRSFKAVVAGEYDHLPEAAFYMVGTIEDAVKKAEQLAAEAA